MRAALILIALIAGCVDDDAPEAATTPAAPAAPGGAPPAAAASLAIDGHALFDHHCAGCHLAGPGHPGTMRLALRLGDARAALLAREDLAPDSVEQIVCAGMQMMPPFRPSEISRGELNAIAGYVAQNFAGH